MKSERLTEMANDIAAFFAADPDQDVAEEGVAEHLRRFWDPRMRQGLAELVRETGGADLHPLVRGAVQRLATVPVRVSQSALGS
ncbi:MAG TPA: formate dehydrogenase [Gammaproteobacteria bacterium]|nr:formate dehydrogenase [Gammaproteobacteria bacterium]